MSTKIAIVIGCIAAQGMLGLQPQHAVSASAGHARYSLESMTAIVSRPDQTRSTLPSRLRMDRTVWNGTEPFQATTATGGSQIATLITLPSLVRRGPSEALAVNEAGTVIVGYAWDRSSLLHAVKWTLQNGSWAISSLPWPQGATSTIGRAVDTLGKAAGNDFPGTTSRPLLWPTMGAPILLCDNSPGAATVYGISGGDEVVVGRKQPTGAAVWRLGGCREDLPSLVGGGSIASAANGNGTIVGGSASLTPSFYVPVRWKNIAGHWQIEQLDHRRGTVHGANAAGDVAGRVDVVPCASTDDCQRAMIWYAAGGFTELDTLGGEDSWARDINATGEVVGGSTASNGINTAFFWSPNLDLGMFQLPFNGRWAAANAVSDVRSDGTRLVVGMDSSGEPVAWVVRNP